MRIFVVDNQPLFREGIKRLAADSQDLKIVGEAATCRDLGDVSTNFELLILDGEMDSLDMLQSIGKRRARGRPPFTLVITEKAEELHATQMLRAGADGYLEKSVAPEIILAAIRKVGRGGKYVGGYMTADLVVKMHQQRTSTLLSTREYQVLHMIASGLAAKEIAARLSLSVKTVSTYRSRLLEKLQLTRSAELIRYALNEGIVV